MGTEAQPLMAWPRPKRWEKPDPVAQPVLTAALKAQWEAQWLPESVSSRPAQVSQQKVMTNENVTNDK